MELANAQSDSMRNSGIYYWYDEADIRKGKAMIIGPEGTPYANCPFIFSLELPNDYPFNPPIVQVLTSDGKTRFHPNLYVTGKVCLSILGTWTGPKWSAVMNISTVLSSIQSLLEENPITNEPGFEKCSLTEGSRAEAYAEVVRFRLLAFALPGLISCATGTCPGEWAEFADVLQEISPHLLERASKTVSTFAQRERGGPKVYENVPYTMNGRTAWKELETFMLGKLGGKIGATSSSPAATS